jgi:hypothetical protein
MMLNGIWRGLRGACDMLRRQVSGGSTLSELQAAADPAVVSRRLLPSITNQPWATA